MLFVALKNKQTNKRRMTGELNIETIADQIASIPDVADVPFDTKTSKKTRNIVITIVVLLLLAGAGVAIYFLVIAKKGGGGNDNGNGGKSTFTLSALSLVQSDVVPDPNNLSDISITNLPATLFLYFTSTTTVASLTASYGGQQVAQVTSPTPNASGQYWIPLDLTSFVGSSQEANAVAITATNTSSQSATGSTANTLQLSLQPQFVALFSNDSTAALTEFTWNMPAWNNAGTNSADNSQTFYSSNYVNISDSGKTGSFGFLPSGSFKAGSTWSAFNFVFDNICGSYPSSSTDVKFYNTGSNKQCYNGQAFYSTLSGSQCIQSMFVGFPSYSNGKGPYIQAPGTSAGSYVISLNDSTPCT